MKRILIAALFLFAGKLSFAAPGTNSNASASVTGTVVDAATKKPLADVTIVAVIGNNKTETVTTNAQGQFKINALPQGTYVLKASKDEYKVQEKKDVVVKQDNTAKVTIELIAEETEEKTHRNWWDKFNLYE